MEFDYPFVASFIFSIYVPWSGSIITDDGIGFLTGFFNCLLCIFHNQFLSKSINKVLCPTGNPNSKWIQAGKFHCIPDHITPQTCICRNDQCVIFIQLYILQSDRWGIVIMNMFQRHKFIENSIIKHQQQIT